MLAIAALFVKVSCHLGKELHGRLHAGSYSNEKSPPIGGLFVSGLAAPNTTIASARGWKRKTATLGGAPANCYRIGHRIGVLRRRSRVSRRAGLPRPPSATMSGTSHDPAPMPKPLPVKLGNEPLVEAICQIQVVGKVPVHTFFPGLLLAKHEGDVSDIQLLPAAMMPQPLRDLQPQLVNLPVTQLKYKSVEVAIGDGVVNVVNPKPYLGWIKFKPLVLEVFEELLHSGQIIEIKRHSIKYTNVLENVDVAATLKMLNWKVQVGELDLDLRATHLRTESKMPDFSTIVEITGSVTMQAAGKPPVQGTLVSVDTISLHPAQQVKEFLSAMSEALEQARLINKQAFFECLTREAIDELEPRYE